MKLYINRLREMMERGAVDITAQSQTYIQASYPTPAIAQQMFFSLMHEGYDAIAVGIFITADLTDAMIEHDDNWIRPTAINIERFLPDVCYEEMTQKEKWEEAFHLAHDRLIDRYRFEPPLNEELAVAVADYHFPQ